MLALVAGTGALPSIIAEKARPGVIVALEGFPPDDLTPTLSFSIETLGTLLRDLGDRGVTEIAFAGAIRRPPIDPAAIDAATLPLVPRMMSALGQGDDAALRIVIEIFEEAGMTVRAIHDIAPDLLPKAGSDTARSPDRDTDEEIIRASKALKAMGEADIGQSCVVHQGQIIAVEASFGTDWMLASLTARPDEGGGLLFKAPKPRQDRRIDLPVIGPDTLRAAAHARLDGVVIEERGVMVLDYPACVKEADAAGLILWVRKPSEAA